MGCTSEARVARYYDPTTAQFLTRDPIEPITQQPYQYANGDPLDRVDPLGLCGWTDPFDCNPVGAVASAASKVGGALSTAAGAVADGAQWAGHEVAAHGDVIATVAAVTGCVGFTVLTDGLGAPVCIGGALAAAGIRVGYRIDRQGFGCSLAENAFDLGFTALTLGFGGAYEEAARELIPAGALRTWALVRGLAPDIVGGGLDVAGQTNG